MRETQYAGHSHSQSKSDSLVIEDKERTWMCEVSIEASEESTIEPSNIRGTTPAIPIESTNTSPPSMILVEIQGLEKGFFDMRNAKSGLTIMKMSEGYLEGDDEEDVDNEAKNENSEINIFIRVDEKDSKITDIDTATRSRRNQPTIFTKMIVVPEAAVDLVDFPPRVGEVDGNVEIEVEVHSGNIFHRESNDTTRKLKQRKIKRQKNKALGELTTLVVRIVAPNGAEPINNIVDTRNMVFYDSVCLKSQYAACSKNQMIIKPFDGTTTTGVKIEKGVVDVAVDINPMGPSEQNPDQKSNKDKFVSRAERMAEEKLGPLADQFDLVLFCIPPGTGEDWKAFANVNRYDSYYNNEWCGHISAQLHEVGHNLNLAHSGEGEARDQESRYEDKSGMMGSSYPNNDAPKMCFNGPKNYQLNWYTNQQLSIDPTGGKPQIMTETSKIRTFVMNGIVDYIVEGDTQGKLVSLRLDQMGTQHDYYIGYNRASGFNEGTQEDINEIVVWEKPTGGPYNFGESWKLTSLRYKDQLYVISDFGRRKHFVEIKLLTNPTEGGYNNGKQDISISITSYKAAGYCKHPEALRIPFQLKGRTDDYGYETSWSLKEDSSAGGYVDFGSGYNKNTAFESTNILCPGKCYVFEFNDLYGDGLCSEENCGDKTGFFLGNLGGDEVFSGSSFDTKVVLKRFCVPEINPPERNSICNDSKNLKYRNGKDRDCSWVRKKKKKRCDRIWKGQLLSEWCPSACKMCS